MIRKEVTITHPDGLQSRAAVLLVQVACKYNARVRIEQGTKMINAKSMMGVLSLGAAPKSAITLCVDGDDEQQAMAALTQLIASGFADVPRK